MSIAAPNYNNLPSKQAEKRLQEKAEQEPKHSSMGSRGQKKPPALRALCHPERVSVTPDRICRQCANAKLNRAKATDLTPEQALEIVKNGGDERLRKQAQALLQSNLTEYARIHVEAARIAAAKGDSRPVEWALQHIKAGDSPTVAAPAKDGGGGGIRVMIGVNLGGMPASVQAQTITVPSEHVEALSGTKPLDGE